MCKHSFCWVTFGESSSFVIFEDQRLEGKQTNKVYRNSNNRTAVTSQILDVSSSCMVQAFHIFLSFLSGSAFQCYFSFPVNWKASITLCPSEYIHSRKITYRVYLSDTWLLENGFCWVWEEREGEELGWGLKEKMDFGCVPTVCQAHHGFITNVGSFHPHSSPVGC